MTESEIKVQSTSESVIESEIPMAKLKDIKVSDYMRESIDKVAIAEGFKNYVIHVDHGSSIGDGYVGLIVKVIIQESESDKVLKVLAKIPPDNQARRAQFGTMKLFEREVYVYNVLLPEFVEFQKERKISDSMGFFNFPKVYFANYDEEKDDSIIIMEDLRDSNHQMWSKYKPINYEHAKLFLQALGRFHAISFAMKAQMPEKFEKFKKMEDLLVVNMVDSNMKGFMQDGIRKVANLLDDSSKAKTKVLNIAENITENFKFCLNPEIAEPYAVITHGDCWFNNFIYHYKKKDLPDGVVLIDWQVSRYVSPVTDLVNFMFICTDQHLRAKHFDEFLNIYHRSLKELLDNLGGDTMSQFPFTALIRQLKKFGKLGEISASFALPMMTVKSDTMPDMDYMAEQFAGLDTAKQEELLQLFMNQKDDNSELDERSRRVILDAMRYGYL